MDDLNYRDDGTYDFKDFQRLFRVRVPMVATLTAYEVEEFGMYNNYDDKGNNFVMDVKNPGKTLSIKVEPYLTVARIIEVHSEGYSIDFLEDKTRLKELYDIVDGYLGYREQLASLTLHKLELGDEGLYEKAGKFIKEVYGNNRQTISRALIDTTASGFNLGIDFIGQPIKTPTDEEYDGIKFNMPDPNTWRI